MGYTWPQTSCLSDDKSNVLRALLHLAGKIECCGEDKIGIRLSNLSFGVESLEVYLSGSNGLLSGRHALAELDEFCQPLVSCGDLALSICAYAG